jgi:DoxX-like family
MDHLSTTRLWVRRTLAGVAIVFFLLDGVAKLTQVAAVVEAAARLGAPESTLSILGVLPLACTIFYALPRNAPLGVVFVMAFLGCAIAMHLLVGDPVASHAPFPVYSAGFVWAGLLLREPRVGRLLGRDLIELAARGSVIEVTANGSVASVASDRGELIADPEPTVAYPEHVETVFRPLTSRRASPTAHAMVGS